MRKKKIKFKVGDVFQISLSNGKYTYGRVYRDASVGIYNHISERPNEPPIGSRDFMFIVGMYDDVLSSGKCPIIGYDGFEDQESEWPPRYFIKDKISGKYSIYYKGEIKPSSEEECEGLEEAAVWDLHHIVDRIIKRNV
jgi:hypothetical protein